MAFRNLFILYITNYFPRAHCSCYSMKLKGRFLYVFSYLVMHIFLFSPDVCVIDCKQKQTRPILLCGLSLVKFNK